MEDYIISSRRQHAESEVEITTVDEIKAIEKSISKEEERQANKEVERLRIQQSSAYKRVDWIATAMDKYFLDPIIGLFPVIGDFLSAMFVLPFLRVSIFVVHSLPLTLAIIFNQMVDVLLGCIPTIGAIADFFYQSNLKNFKLIKGYVEDDKEVIKSVNKRAVWMGSGILLVCVAIYFVISWAASLLSGASNLVQNIVGWFKDEPVTEIQYTPTEHRSEPTICLQEWCDAHTNGSIYDMSDLYADNLKYYQSYYTREQVKSSKTDLFNKYTDFSQSYSDLTITNISKGKVVLDFMKVVTINGKHSLYKSYLVLSSHRDKWQIVEEGDITTDKNLFKKRKEFVRGVQKYAMSKGDNDITFTYKSAGYEYNVHGFFNQVDMDFVVSDKQGNQEHLNFKGYAEEAGETIEFLIGTYDFNYDGLSELVIAKRTVGASTYDNIAVSVYGLKNYKWSELTQFSDNVLSDHPTVDLITNRIHCPRHLRDFYDEKSFVDGKFIDTSNV